MSATTARPYQVGDRVLISGWGTTGPREIVIDDIAPADPHGRFGPYISGDGPNGVGTCSMNDDLTGVQEYDTHTVELLEPASTNPSDDAPEFEVGSTVQQTLTLGIGVVKPRDAWFPTGQLDEYPDHIVVEYADGTKTLTHPKWFTPAPEGATPTNPSGGAVTSTPALSDDTTPSLVALDQREAVAERALTALIEWRKAGDVKAHITATVALRKAADEYIAEVSR